MIGNTFEDAFSPEWVGKNITYPAHELVVLRKIIPWEKIIGHLTPFYDRTAGAVGKSLRTMAALLTVSRLRGLSDREVVRQVKENRYIRYFCNVPDEGLQTFLHPSSLGVFRKRLGEEGAAFIGSEIFKMLLRAGVIRGDEALIDSTVLESDIICPNDVRLIYKAFGKLGAFCRLHGISFWWDDTLPKKLWRKFCLDKKGNRAAWLIRFYELFVPALKIFREKIRISENFGQAEKQSP